MREKKSETGQIVKILQKSVNYHEIREILFVQIFLSVGTEIFVLRKFW